MRTASLTFAVFGVVQLLVAIATVRLALAVDGLHNVQESLVVGINRKGRTWVSLPPGLRACWIGPLAPAISSAVAITGAVIFLVVGSHYASNANTWAALVLVAASFVLNLWFTRKMSHADHESDPNAENVFWHFAGDTASSLVAVAAYGIIAVSSSHLWLDPAAAIVGTAIIVLVHLSPTAKSIRAFVNHRRNYHPHA